MMTYAYDKEYLPLVQRVMGDMYDYAVNTLDYDLKEFHKMFLISGMAKQFQIANTTFVAGKNGCEVAKDVVKECCNKDIEMEDIMYLDKSPEYWIGWALAYYQWSSAMDYQMIEKCVPITEIYGMYATYHEMDITQFVIAMNAKCNEERVQSQLKRLRAYAGLSQKQLAEASGISLRQVQLFEQGQRDIHKTGGNTILQLARALHCKCEDIL